MLRWRCHPSEGGTTDAWCRLCGSRLTSTSHRWNKMLCIWLKLFKYCVNLHTVNCFHHISIQVVSLCWRCLYWAPQTVHHYDAQPPKWWAHCKFHLFAMLFSHVSWHRFLMMTLLHINPYLTCDFMSCRSACLNMAEGVAELQTQTQSQPHTADSMKPCTSAKFA